MAPRKKTKKSPARAKRKVTGRAQQNREAYGLHQIATSRFLNGFISSRFPNLVHQLAQIDRNIQKQVVLFKKMADLRTAQLRKQMDKVLIEMTKRIRKNLQKDLKRVEVTLRDLATRVNKLEQNIKKALKRPTSSHWHCTYFVEPWYRLGTGS